MNPPPSTEAHGWLSVSIVATTAAAGVVRPGELTEGTGEEDRPAGAPESHAVSIAAHATTTTSTDPTDHRGATDIRSRRRPWPVLATLRSPVDGDCQDPARSRSATAAPGLIALGGTPNRRW